MPITSVVAEPIHGRSSGAQAGTSSGCSFMYALIPAW